MTNKILLKEEYIARSVSNEHLEISKIPWKRIYTTNYDDVIERSSNETGNYRIPVTLSQSPYSIINKDNTVIHLNGYIENITPEKLYSEFRLTSNSYANDDFINSAWITFFKQDLEICKAVIFIGYSLRYDIDIQKILVNINNINEKCIFITGKDIIEPHKDIISDYGKLYPIGLSNFTKEIRKVASDYVPMDYEDTFNCFHYFNTDKYCMGKVGDDDILDLFFKGYVNLDFIFNKSHANEYLVDRNVVKKCVKALNENTKSIIIHSDLGNGKSCIILSLASILINYGNVFLLKKINQSLSEEIERISKINGLKYIIIEDYNLYINCLNIFKLFDTEKTKYIFTARSFINDVFFAQLIDAMKIQESRIAVFEVNKLEDNEINNLIQLFDNYHLWGEYANYSDFQKNKLIKKEYKREFKNLLIGLFESEAIEKKLNELVDIITSNKDIEEIVITAFINSILGLNLCLDDIIYLMGKIYISASISTNIKLKELIDIQQNDIKVRSSILAQYIIKNYKIADDVIDILIKIMVSADNKDYNQRYSSLKRLLISFSNLKLILRGKGSDLAGKVKKYYESIKNLNYTKENPFFWLQYAIARLEFNDYAGAHTYFSNAYAYSHKLDNFDTFQLDTHYARYLLENQLSKDTPQGAFDVFIEAHNLIYNNRNKPEHLHYPLKHAKYYIDYFKKYYAYFSETEKAKFIFCCYQVMNKIKMYNKTIDMWHSTRHKDVIEAERCINIILKSLGHGDVGHGMGQ